MITQEVIQNRLNAAIAKHGPDANKAIRDLIAQGENLVDHLCNSHQLAFESGENNEDNVQMVVADINSGQGELYDMHDNAITQFCERFDLPGTYVRESAHGEPWQRKIASGLMHSHADNMPVKTLLVRSVSGQVRAVLSNAYRRMNSVPIFLSFADACQGTGAVLMNGVCGELKSYLEVVLPTLHMIETPNNGIIWIAFGAQISSSDFGQGSLEVKECFWQGVCMNGAVGARMIREIHLGKRLDAANFAFSAETYAKDTETMKLAVRDIAKDVLSIQSMEKNVARIKGASNEIVDMPSELKRLPKMGLTKAEVDLVEKVLMRSSVDDGVTGEPTRWKLQQAVSAVARDAEPLRMRDIQVIAGGMLEEVN